MANDEKKRDYMMKFEVESWRKTLELCKFLFVDLQL